MGNDKVYYSDLNNLAERIAMGLNNRNQPLDELSQALKVLSSTNAIQGQAADSMKAYINEVHLTLIQTLQLALTNYQMALGKYVKGYLQVDSSHSFEIVREDLEESQSKLTSHRSEYTNLAQQLRNIANEAAGIIDLNGAGSSKLKQVATQMDDMKRTAHHLVSDWDSYEGSDPGFNQINDLIQQTRHLIKQTLNVPRGYSYSPGSFSQLMSPDFLKALQANSNYASNEANQEQFAKDWQSITQDYATAQKRLAEAKAKKQAKEAGLWGLVTDALQTIAGVAIAAVGLGLTPFSGGLSLGLVALGGSLAIGGINSGINHGSMAISGQGYNLIGHIANGVGNFYNHTLGKSLGQTGVGGYTNGILAGAGEFVSGTAQFNVVDTAQGVYTLATSHQVQAQFAEGVGSWWKQLSGGNVYVAGQTTATIASLFVGGKGAVTGKVDEATNLVSKLGHAKTALVTKGNSLAKGVEGNIKNLVSLVKNTGNPRVAFAEAGEHGSILNRVDSLTGEVPKNSVRQNFNQAGKETGKSLDNKLGNVAKKHPIKSTFEIENAKYADASGRPDWSQAPNGGYDMKEPIVHNVGDKIKVGDQFDRFGPENGSYISPKINGQSFTYDSRSLPYTESSMEYHQYVWKVEPTSENIVRAFKKRPEILDDINNRMIASGKDPISISDFKRLNIIQGYAAPAFGRSGGAIQQEVPILIGDLKDLGIIGEI